MTFHCKFALRTNGPKCGRLRPHSEWSRCSTDMSTNTSLRAIGDSRGHFPPDDDAGIR